MKTADAQIIAILESIRDSGVPGGGGSVPLTLNPIRKIIGPGLTAPKLFLNIGNDQTEDNFTPVSIRLTAPLNVQLDGADITLGGKNPGDTTDIWTQYHRQFMIGVPYATHFPAVQPGTTLYVKNSLGTSGLAHIYSECFSDTAGSANTIGIVRSRGTYTGTSPGPAGVQNGDLLGQFAIAGRDDVAAAPNDAVIMKVTAKQDFTTGHHGAKMEFQLCKIDSSTLFTVLTFDENGDATFGSGSKIKSPTLETPALGTPASGVLTNCTGTASGLTAGNATLAASATMLATGRLIGGKSFNGAADIKPGTVLVAKSANYTITSAELNGGIVHPTTDANDRTFTLPTGLLGLADGDTVTIINPSVRTVTVTVADNALQMDNTGTSGGNVTIPAWNIATLMWSVSDGVWLVAGTPGISVGF